MAKKKRKHLPQTGAVWHRSAEQATLDQMPKYNAHICKTGPHGNAKYDRAKVKRDWQRDISRESARNRGRSALYGHAVFSLAAAWQGGRRSVPLMSVEPATGIEPATH